MGILQSIDESSSSFGADSRFQLTRPQMRFVQFLKGCSPIPLSIPCADSDGGTNCCLILLQGPLSPFLLTGGQESHSRFGANSSFQLTLPELRFAQVLKGLCPIPPRMPGAAKGMAELSAV